MHVEGGWGGGGGGGLLPAAQNGMEKAAPSILPAAMVEAVHTPIPMFLHGQEKLDCRTTAKDGAALCILFSADLTLSLIIIFLSIEIPPQVRLSALAGPSDIRKRKYIPSS